MHTPTASLHHACTQPALNLSSTSQERIKLAGGRVLWQNGLRVMGALSMTRAIGDHFLRPHGVIAEPEISSVRRSATDEFLLLATDGLWNFVSGEEAAAVAQRALARAEAAALPRRAAALVVPRALTKLALLRGGMDNVTVMMVDLRPGGAASEATPMMVTGGKPASSIDAAPQRAPSPPLGAAKQQVRTPCQALQHARRGQTPSEAMHMLLDEACDCEQQQAAAAAPAPSSAAPSTPKALTPPPAAPTASAAAPSAPAAAVASSSVASPFQAANYQLLHLNLPPLKIRQQQQQGDEETPGIPPAAAMGRSRSEAAVTRQLPSAAMARASSAPPRMHYTITTGGPEVPRPLPAPLTSATGVNHLAAGHSMRSVHGGASLGQQCAVACYHTMALHGLQPVPGVHAGAAIAVGGAIPGVAAQRVVSSCLGGCD